MQCNKKKNEKILKELQNIFNQMDVNAANHKIEKHKI